ncbi:MAG: DoxX family protein [Pseudolabrys sp.]
MPDGERLQQLGILLLRTALGVMFFAHGFILKFWTIGMEGTVRFFGVLGFPGWLAYPTAVAETVGGVMLVLGIQTRWVALALLPVVLGALWVHSGNGWLFEAKHGGWEFPLYLVVLCIAQAMLGDGAHALSPSWPERGRR